MNIKQIEDLIQEVKSIQPCNTKDEKSIEEIIRKIEKIKLHFNFWSKAEKLKKLGAIALLLKKILFP